VHDGIELERRGVATGVIVTDAFVGAARAMAAIDGLPDYRFAVVPHPTADMDDRALAAATKSATEQLLGILISWS